jgi:hypothetical protein
MSDTRDTGPQPHNLQHIRIEGLRAEASYSPPHRDLSGRSSGRNREIHGRKLSAELGQALTRAHELLTDRNAHFASGREGVYVEVESAEGVSSQT